ncbi:MAG: hypothetical protein KAT58_06590 [candidate division Zixibacteria bacterium]|nr:hypothetical protein [candidate division Zixibacteria bacterium]
MNKDHSHFWLDILLILLKWKKYILLNVFSAAVVVALLSLALPNWYRGEATILPPESQQQAINLGSALPSIFGGMELPMMASPSDVLAAIAQSRVVAESVIVKFKLMDVYGNKYMERAVETFHDHMKAEVLDNGMVHITYIAKEPVLAANVTNQLVDELDQVNRSVTVSRARNSREFIESLLQETLVALRFAEDSLVSFQEKNRAVMLDEQTKAQIEIVSQLQSEKTLANIELALLLKSMESTHPKVTQMADRITELHDQIRKIEFGGDDMDSSFLLHRPLVDLPDLAVELARLMRNVKIQETVYELLTSQYEQAKIEESKTTSTISVLDRAAVPELKFKPKRSVLVLVAAFIALILSLLWVWLIEFLLDLKKTDAARFAKWRTILKSFWLHRLFKRLNLILDT